MNISTFPANKMFLSLVNFFIIYINIIQIDN